MNVKVCYPYKDIITHAVATTVSFGDGNQATCFSSALSNVREPKNDMILYYPNMPFKRSKKKQYCHSVEISSLGASFVVETFVPVYSTEVCDTGFLIRPI